MRIYVRPPERPRGKNQHSPNHMARARSKRAWEEAAIWGYRRIRHSTPGLKESDRPHDVRVALPMSQPQRADPHNFTSYEVAYIIDGLVKVGLFPNDTAEIIKVHDPVLFKGFPERDAIVAIDEPLPTKEES